MAARRFLQVSTILAVLGIMWPISLCAAHGGGGGGGGGGRGAGSSGGAHYSGGYAHAPGYAGGSYYGGHPQANYAHAGPNANFQSAHHPYGYGGWGHNDWDHGFQNAYWGRGWYGPWGWGLCIGWGWGFGWGWGWGYPFGWGGYWDDYFCPYGPVYASAYPVDAYAYMYPNDGQYAANYPSAPAPTVADNAQPAADDGTGTANEGLLYYNEARTAFGRGDYRNALRLAGHAAVESPQNAKVHELISLSLFASGEYRVAATEAHAALALGAPSDWNNLFGYYRDAAKYTEQLRKLEKTVSDVPNSAPGHFLLAYHYLMTGAKDEAKSHFAQAAKLTPNDKLAAHILKELEGGETVKPPELPAPPRPGDQKGKDL